MPYASNSAAIFPKGITARAVAVPSTQKTVFTDASNTSVLLDRSLAADTGDNRMQVGKVFFLPTANVVAGKGQLYLWNGTTARLVKEVKIDAQTGITTTNPGVAIDFGYTPADPLIVGDGESLLGAVTTAQAAGALIAHAQQITVL